MSITSFDHFIETLETVPCELQRNFSLMADLDRRNGELVRRINECVREYRKTDRRDERSSLLKESMDLFDKARSYSDDKVDLAMQTYDLVDKHIRRLECINGAQAIGFETNNTSNSVGGVGVGQTQEGRNRDGVCGGAGGLGGGGSGGGGIIGCIATEPLAVDMPLDPNEPKYCTCHQVSFGEMIACDNKECPIEWFHFACVDLKSKPKGKWYCPECFNINKKGKHRHLKRQKT